VALPLVRGLWYVSERMTPATDAADSRWMRRALQLAAQAGERGEVPVGAVIVREGVEIGAGHNQPIASSDPTAHAEIVAVRQAAAREGNYRLPRTILYVTMEPCSMCVGALIHARVQRVVFGALDPKGGALGSVIDLNAAGLHNHRLEVAGGMLADESAALLQSFFRHRRQVAVPGVGPRQSPGDA